MPHRDICLSLGIRTRLKKLQGLEIACRKLDLTFSATCNYLMGNYRIIISNYKFIEREKESNSRLTRNIIKQHLLCRRLTVLSSMSPNVHRA